MARIVQFCVALSAALSMTFVGTVLSWPSPVLLKYQRNETQVNINDVQISWMISLAPISTPIGSVLAKFGCDSIGRKWTIMAASIPALISSVLILVTKSPEVLYVARIFGGTVVGLLSVAVGIYLTEIADKNIRGALGILALASYHFGNLIIYCIGPFVSYTTLNSIVVAVPLCFLATCSWVPETPYFYLKEGKLSQAKASLKVLKNPITNHELERELTVLDKQVQVDMKGKTTLKELVTKKQYRRAIIINLVLKVGQNLTGSIAIQSYLGKIFGSIAGEKQVHYISIIYGILQLISCLTAVLMVDKVGRRLLLLISSFGTGLSLTLVGLYFYLISVNVEPKTYTSLSYLPWVAILMYNFFFNSGIGSLPSLMQNELFPTNVRPVASSAATFVGSLMIFVATKSYQNLKDSFGIHIVFWSFAGISFACFVVMHFCVPETKGKSLQEIQDDLQNVPPRGLDELDALKGEIKTDKEELSKGEITQL